MKQKNDKTYKDEEIISALLDSYGVILSASRLLGCSRRTIERRIKESESVKEAKHTGKCMFKEEAENTILNAVLSGNVDAAKYVLSRIGKEDGWGDKQELDVATKGQIVVVGSAYERT